MKYGSLTLGQVEAIVNKLGGELGVRFFLTTGMLITSALEVGLTVWKTVRINIGDIMDGKSVKQLLQVLKERGVRIRDDSYERIAACLKWQRFAYKAELIRISVADLGFKTSVSSDLLFARAEAIGLHLCSPDVAFQLLMDGVDFAPGEFVSIAMEPMVEKRQDARYVLCIGCTVGVAELPSRALGDLNLNFPCLPDDDWIFCIPK